MMRLPYGLSVGRASDVDAGGVADLQTDVMRFMAILALLLAIRRGMLVVRETGSDRR